MERQQLNDLEEEGRVKRLAASNLNWRAAYICGNSPAPPTQKGTLAGKGAEATGPQPCPNPGLEAYLTSQTNAKEKADVGWGWGDSGFLEVSLERQRDSPFIVQIRPGNFPTQNWTKSILKGQKGSPCPQSEVPHGTSRSKGGGNPRTEVSPSPRAGEQERKQAIQTGTRKVSGGG